MRSVLLFITALLAGAVCMGPLSANAAPLPMPGIAAKAEIGVAENVGWRWRYYRRYGYPYAYDPPAYGYYYPPPAYGYAPAYPAYPYYAPYRYCRPYYAPYY
jgi:hypothetical protein